MAGSADRGLRQIRDDLHKGDACPVTSTVIDVPFIWKMDNSSGLRRIKHIRHPLVGVKSFPLMAGFWHILGRSAFIALEGKAIPAQVCLKPAT